MITIDASVIHGMIVHAKNGLPIEVCGYAAEQLGVIDAWYPLTNVDASAEHFSLDPKEQFAAIKKMRAEGRKLAAVYHSHPATPSRPSDEDIALAADPSLSYIIVSLAGSEPVVKSFEIKNKKVTEQPIRIRNSAGGIHL